MTSSEAATLLESALRRPVAYHRAFADISGKVSAGLMLSQAWYWTPRTKKEDGWFYKTRNEWREETGMTRTEQETARKRLVKLGLLEEKLAGMPAKLHFRVNRERLISLLVENPPTRRRKTCQQDGTEPANMSAEKPPAITESTAESKTETTKDLSAHARLMDHLQVKYGAISNGGQQGKAVKWLLEHYDPVECIECFDFLAGEEWRTAQVSWVTVQSQMGSFLARAEIETNGNGHRPRTASERNVRNIKESLAYLEGLPD